MSWALLLTLAGGSYLLKAGGLLGLSRLSVTERLEPLTGLLPAAVLAGLVVVQTFSDARALVLDARAAGVLVGAIAAWLRAPFLVVVVLAAGTAAAVRAVS